MTTAYDPPVELEGPNSGLGEAVASRLWAKRASLFSKRASPRDFSDQSEQVKVSWRRTADVILDFLLGELGFTGPAGPPRMVDSGWSYSWNGDIDSWEIVDDTGGAVALVVHHQDLTMLAAAPVMAARIRELLAAIEGTAAADLPQIVALRDSLPSPPTKATPND